MVLVSLITWAARKSLHKQDYSFDEQLEEASAKGGGLLELTRPQQYLVLGFKDRNLEARFLDDLARVSQPRTILGYTMALLMVAVGRLMYDTIYYVLTIRFTDDDTDEYPLYFIMSALAILVFGLGLVATLVIMKRESIKQKRVVLVIVEAAFLLYTVVSAPTSSCSPAMSIGHLSINPLTSLKRTLLVIRLLYGCVRLSA